MSRSPRGGVALVAVLVVLAGCSTLGGWSGGPATDVETVTAAPVPTSDQEPVGTPSPTPVPANGTADAYPPGIGPGGITDYLTLLGAHWRALDGRSFTVVKYGSYADDEPVDQRVAVANDTTYLVVEDGSPVQYVDPSGTYDRLQNGRVIVSRTRLFQYASFWYTGLRYLSMNGTRVERVEDGNVTYARLHMTEASSRVPPAVTNYTATAFVRASGWIETVAVSYDRRVDGRTRHVAARWTYRRVGNTTVTKPDWVDRAREGEFGDDWDRPVTDSKGTATTDGGP